MRPFWILMIFAGPAFPHAVSMSSSDPTVEGARGHWVLRMPIYEITHVATPERTLIEHVKFAGARLAGSRCGADASQGMYVCEADYVWESPVETVGVECTLAAATVPNHVHLLRASMPGKQDQALFDLSFTRATLRFRPPTAAEVAVEQMTAGGMRALGGAVELLFLIALVLAARGRRELAALAGMFVLGQSAGALATYYSTWSPAPRFVEAAAALTVAYLAVEVVMLPKAGARWAVAGVLGVFHGLYLFLFLQTTGYEARWVLGGAGGAQVVVIGALAVATSKVPEMARRVCAGGMVAVGLGWFVMRLRG